jgi:hypothetical protein
MEGKDLLKGERMQAVKLLASSLRKPAELTTVMGQLRKLQTLLEVYQLQQRLILLAYV